MSDFEELDVVAVRVIGVRAVVLRASNFDDHYQIYTDNDSYLSLHYGSITHTSEVVHNDWFEDRAKKYEERKNMPF